MSNVIVFTDGGARGNPGPAALGVFIQDANGKSWQESARRLELPRIMSPNIRQLSRLLIGCLLINSN